jgi:hypothetical protein
MAHHGLAQISIGFRRIQKLAFSVVERMELMEAERRLPNVAEPPPENTALDIVVWHSDHSRFANPHRRKNDP